MTYEEYAKYRDEKGLTDYKISKETNISRSMFTDWKNGKYKPKHDKILQLKEYFGIEEIKSNDEIVYNEDSHTWDMKEEKSYYINEDANDYAQFLLEHPGHKVLFDACKNIKAEDMSKALKAIGLFTDED